MAVALVAFAGCGSGDKAEGLPGGPSSKRFTLHPRGSVEGAPTGCIEYVPPGYGDGAPRPLLVDLHGAGENGDGSGGALELLSSTGLPALIRYDPWPQARPFIGLMPQPRPRAYEDVCPDADNLSAGHDIYAWLLRHRRP